MFFKINTIKNVESFEIYFEQAFFLLSNNDIVDIINTKQNLFELPRINDKSLLITTNDGLEFSVKKKDETLFKYHNNKNIGYSINSFLIFDDSLCIGATPEIDIENYKINYKNKGIYNHQSSEYIHELDIKDSCEYLYNDSAIIIYQENLTMFYAFNLQDCQQKWVYNLSKLGNYVINGENRKIELQKFIGVHNETLWVKAGNLIILGIDIHTGKQKVRIDYQEPFAVLENLELDKTNNCIFSIGPQHYFELNLESLSYQLFDIILSTQKHQIEMYYLGTWEDNLIYFWEGSDNNRFGIFDRNIKEIIWSDEIAEVKNFSPAILSVKHGSNKLYVHDFHNTLHVFEKRLN